MTFDRPYMLYLDLDDVIDDREVHAARDGSLANPLHQEPLHHRDQSEESIVVT